MKTTIVFVLILFVAFSGSAFAQKEGVNLIKNGDFEKFLEETPEGWETSNIPGTLTVVSASKQSHTGQRALKCEVKDFGGALVTGYACQKNIRTGGMDLHLTAAFLLRSIEKDRGVIILCFMNASGSTIGTVEEYIEDTRSKFVEVSKDIKPPSGTALLHVRITLFPEAGGEKTHVGSYLLCDDLRLAAVSLPEKPLIQ